MGLRHSLKRRFGRSKISSRLQESYPDITDPAFHAAMELCGVSSMTSVDRLHALFTATRYVADARVPGAFVECGVWKGGSVMMMAATLKAAKITDRDIYLFDTFTGMPEPDDKDVDYTGTPMSEVTKTNPNWLKAGMDEVRANVARTDYPMARFHFVPGDVLETIPAQAPAEIALLRLDTDWHKSTAHELAHLFSRLSRRGVLIIDDYGHYRGVREAVDEFFARLPERYFLQRIDYTGRLMIKA
jgi:O-methyltransferase